MAAKDCISRFRDEISKIIAEIEDYIGTGRGTDDREFRFQRRAFRERCDQAENLDKALDSPQGENEWSLHDGDAHRIQESLQLSLDYFRREQNH